MKKKLARLLRLLADWLDAPPIPTTPDESLLASARDLVIREETQSAAGTSGEYKRHNVYSRLMKLYPNMRKVDLSIAIDTAVKENL